MNFIQDITYNKIYIPCHYLDDVHLLNREFAGDRQWQANKTFWELFAIVLILPSTFLVGRGEGELSFWGSLFWV